MPSPAAHDGRGTTLLADVLRAAIAKRATLRPGSKDHWRTVCEVKRLQRLLVAAEPPGSRPRCGVEHCADEGQLWIDVSLAIERGLRLGSETVARDGSILVCAGHVLEVTSSHGDAR